MTEGDIANISMHLDNARSGLNVACDAFRQWRQGEVVGVDLTAAQKTALWQQFVGGVNRAKQETADMEAVLDA